MSEQTKPETNGNETRTFQIVSCFDCGYAGNRWEDAEDSDGRGGTYTITHCPECGEPCGADFTVREARITDADLKAVAEAIHGYVCGCKEPGGLGWPLNTDYEQMARTVCDALLGGETDA